MREKDSTMTKGNSRTLMLTASLIAILSYSLARIIANGEPIFHLFPNILFLSPLSDHAHKFYVDPLTILPDKREHERIKEIQADDYSYELMKKVTENFSKPAIVKGLFSNTTAAMNWKKPGYLKNKLGDMNIAVYTQIFAKDAYLTNMSKLVSLPGGEVVEDIITNEKSNLRFVFPQFALDEFNTTDPVALAAKSDELVEELGLHRVREGWGKKNHINYIGQQFFIGRGLKDELSYKGVGWHTEPGNNWFIQVIGKKRWYVMAPQHSALMRPIKRTSRLIRPSYPDQIEKYEERFPVLYGDLEAGDMIFNPEWYWHKTKLFPGPSISVPMREIYPFRNFRSSAFFTIRFCLSVPFEMSAASYIGKVMKKIAGFSLRNEKSNL